MANLPITPKHSGLMILAVLVSTGCRTDHYVGSLYQVGPQNGMAVGTTVGVVAGNALGFDAGLAQGAVSETAAVLDPSYCMARQWPTETTSDGRMVQVPHDVLVDQYGRPTVLSIVQPPP